jgi:hypothetical protein
MQLCSWWTRVGWLLSFAAWRCPGFSTRVLDGSPHFDTQWLAHSVETSTRPDSTVADRGIVNQMGGQIIISSYPGEVAP